MKTKLLIVTTVIATSTCLAQEDQISFENAVFLQETQKDYKKAVETFKAFIHDSTDKSYEARYRLAQCYKILKDENNFRSTITALSEEKDSSNIWVKLAISEAPVGLELSVAPWEDGDVLRYSLDLKNDQSPNYLTLIYEKLEHPSNDAWKITSLRSYRDTSRSEVTFRADTYEPLTSYWYWYDNGMDLAPRTTENKEAQWDKVTFCNEMLLSIFRLLPLGTGAKYDMQIESMGLKIPINVEYPESSDFEFTNKHSEYKGQRVNAKLGSMNLKMGYRTDGKHEMLEVSQHGLNITLSEITTLEEYRNRSLDISNFNKVLNPSNNTIVEETIDNKKLFRAMVYPSEAGILGKFELSQKNDHFKDDPEKFALKIEAKKNDKFTLPANTEELELAGFKGILFITPNEISKTSYLCFYGLNENHGLSYRLLIRNEKQEEAKKELIRFLTNDLISN